MNLGTEIGPATCELTKVGIPVSSFSGVDQGCPTPTSEETPFAAQRESPLLPNDRLEGKAVTRSPNDLRIHPALVELGQMGIDELNEAERLRNHLATSVFINNSGIILS